MSTTTRKTTKAARTTKAPAVTVWPTLPVADLMANAAAPSLSAEDPLTEAVTAKGVTEPLYIATLGDGTYRVVDGLRRLAAAHAAGLETVPVTYRPVIRVDALTKHPHNVRRDLRMTKEFRASIRENGVRTAVLVRRNGAALEVVDGHRRLLGAIAEGLTHIPYTYDEVTDADAYVDMVTTAVHRESLTDVEQASALFQASELGASPRQLAAAAGRTQKDVKLFLKVGGSKKAKAAAASNLTLADVARLVDLEAAAPDLAEQVEAAMAKNPGGSHAWRITDALNTVERRQEAAAHRAQLEKEGAQFRTTGELSDRATPVHQIKGMTYNKGEHATCKGDVWVLETPDSYDYTRYCTNAVLHGHELKGEATKITTGERKRIIAGNSHWDASVTVRQEWLAEFLGRKSHPRATADIMLRIATEAALGADSVVQARQSHPRRDKILGQLLGMTEQQANCASITKRGANVRRAPALLFAAVAACYEVHAPRSAWRTDGDHARAGVRRDTTRYLTWLQELGYQPTPIETAVITGTAYDPADPDAQAANAGDTTGTLTE
ncbi:ParB N-terminal domain-containing protein [Streptomyces sp. NRRL F-525]|uniref:ParB N-terminal domain-containing protein n=1 Tax=Streptomyces sp. NRRL F-525 TaxID=1463861 RepID=UPI00068E54B8|nr:ParB N-terminal domain-containing protein [Streptomyces sp. NRRL F-525]